MRDYAARGDLAPLRMEDRADLELYCYFVAGTVGWLLTDLFVAAVAEARQDTGLRERAISFGIGLQMVNILKDVAQDAQRDVCYLPQAEARRAGVQLEELIERLRAPEPSASLPPERLLLGELAGLAREHLRDGIEYTLAWPTEGGRAVRVFCGVPLALAFATLDEIELGTAALQAQRSPRVTRATVAEVAGAVAAAADDPHEFEALLRGVDRTGARP